MAKRKPVKRKTLVKVAKSIPVPGMRKTVNAIEARKKAIAKQMKEMGM